MVILEAVVECGEQLLRGRMQLNRRERDFVTRLAGGRELDVDALPSRRLAVAWVFPVERQQRFQGF